jgi:ABC-type Fe3+ transport system permease subunit
MALLFLLICVAFVLALPAMSGHIRLQFANSRPRERMRLRLVGGLVTAGAGCVLAAVILLMFAVAAATDDQGSTWANSHANRLVPPMVICIVAGITSFVAAWLVRRRD